MKHTLLLTTIALSALSLSTAFANTLVTSDCHQQAINMTFKHCKTLKKGSARNTCIKRAKAHKHACHVTKRHHAPYKQAYNNQTPAMSKPQQLTTGTDITPAIAPQPA